MKKVYVLTEEGLVDLDKVKAPKRGPLLRVRDPRAEFDVIRIMRGCRVEERTEGGYVTR